MKIDMHIHTTAFSPCSTMDPEQLMMAAKERGLDGVCITEHDRLWSAEHAAELAEKFDLAVFRGMEVTTTGGDILVFGFDEEPGEMWTPAELRDRVDDAGGIAIAAHPFRGFLLFGFGELQMDLQQAMDNPTFTSVHGLETCNSMVTDEENDLARQVAEAMGLLKVGGSDAHKPESVGLCFTTFEDDIKYEHQLVEAIRSGRHTVCRPQ